MKKYLLNLSIVVVVVLFSFTIFDGATLKEPAVYTSREPHKANNDEEYKVSGTSFSVSVLEVRSLTKEDILSKAHARGENLKNKQVSPIRITSIDKIIFEKDNVDSIVVEEEWIPTSDSNEIVLPSTGIGASIASPLLITMGIIMILFHKINSEINKKNLDC